MNDTKPTNPKDAIGIAKTPLHLVSGIANIYASIAHFLGNVKYGAWNWRGAGICNSVYYAALLRHMVRWWNGEENDPSDGTPHLANALCCLNIIIEGKVIGNAIDDRPPAVDLNATMKMVEDLMPKIREKYKHMSPKHWTIEDEITPEHIPLRRKNKKRK